MQQKKINDIRLQYVAQYLRLIKNGHSKLSASQLISESINHGPWMARLIRSWANQYLSDGALLVSRRGKHQKVVSILNDEDIIIKINQYLHVQKFNLKIPDFINYISNEIFPFVGYERNKKISEATARRWLKKMGWEYKAHSKDIYFDGHERPDVVEYRREFLEKMESLERYMPVFEGENMDEEKWPSLEQNEKFHSFVVHDESTFFSNDGLKKFWAPEGEQPLRPKTQGSSLHVSEFLCETIGRLRLNQQQREINNNLPESERIPEEACVVIRPGKNRDEYWNNDKLAKQEFILFYFILFYIIYQLILIFLFLVTRESNSSL